jgi:DNA polymerase-3 subunit delta'
MLFEWMQPYFNQLLQQRERLPQALLIHGPEGIGKYSLAREAGKALLCEQPQATGMACSSCRSCRLIEAGTHPDWFAVSLETNETGRLASEIKIGQIRDLCQSLVQTRHIGPWKIALIHPADRMNRNAANGLLKTLEEPVPNTLLLLVSSRPSRLPATIRSRCQQLRVQAPTPQQAQAWICRQYGDAEANALFAASGGMPAGANMLAAGNLLAVRTGVFDDWSKILLQGQDPLVVAEKWKDADLDWIFFWMIGWLEDLILLKQTDGHSLLNTDLSQPLHNLADKVSLNALFEFYDRTKQAKQLLDSSVNHRLLYESVLLNWAEARGAQQRSV